MGMDRTRLQNHMQETAMLSIHIMFETGSRPPRSRERTMEGAETMTMTTTTRCGIRIVTAIMMMMAGSIIVSNMRSLV